MVLAAVFDLIPCPPEIQKMLRRLKMLFAVLAVVVVAPTTAFAGGELSQQNKVELQVALMDYIEANSVDGKFMHFNAADQTLMGLFPASLHPKIVPTSTVFFLCADFRDAAGSMVDVDFVATKGPDGFIVFQAMLNQHEVIRAMKKKNA